MRAEGASLRLPNPTDMDSSEGNHRERFRQRHGLFDSLDESERRAVQDASQTLKFRRRQRIYMPGDPGDRLFILKSGVVELNIISPEGRELILSFLHPGDIFGELAIIAPEPRDHIAEAYEDATVNAVASDILQGLVQRSPHLAYEVTKLLGRRVQAYRAPTARVVSSAELARSSGAIAQFIDPTLRRFGDRVVSWCHPPHGRRHRPVHRLYPAWCGPVFSSC